jgi:hypothetical protein
VTSSYRGDLLGAIAVSHLRLGPDRRAAPGRGAAGLRPMSENGARPCLHDDAAELQQELAELTGADLDPAALERAAEACGPARDG